MSNIDSVTATFERLDTIINNGVNALTEKGIHEYTAPVNMTSLYLIDERVANSSILKDLISIQLYILTARIAQVFELHNTINGITIVDYIKSVKLGITENKSLFRRIFGLDSISVVRTQYNDIKNTEDLIKFGSFTVADHIEQRNDTDIAPINPDQDINYNSMEAFGKDDTDKKVTPIVNTKNIIADTFDMVSNYAMGTTFDIALQAEGSDRKTTVTLAAKISPVAVSSFVTKSILEIGSYKNSFVERYYSLKAGDITLLQFLTLSDIVDKQVSVLLKDKSGYYKEILSRQSSKFYNGLTSLLSRNKVEIAKTIGGMIIDSQTLAESEVELGGTFDNVDIRNKVFLTTSASTICVIDNNWETVKIYYRGINYTETYTFNQIRRGGKGGVSVEDMLEAFRRGGAPKLQ